MVKFIFTSCGQFPPEEGTVINIKEQQHEWCTYLSMPVAHLPSWLMAVQAVLQQREERYSLCQKFTVLFWLPNNNICRLWKKGLSIFWHIPGSFLCLSGKFLLLLFTKQCEWVSKVSSHVGVYSDWSYEHCGSRSRIIINPHFTTCSGGMKEATEVQTSWELWWIPSTSLSYKMVTLTL